MKVGDFIFYKYHGLTLQEVIEKGYWYAIIIKVDGFIVHFYNLTNDKQAIKNFGILGKMLITPKDQEEYVIVSSK